MKQKKTPRGFTLVELFTIVGLAATLSTLGFSEYQGAISKARRVEAYGVMRTLETAQEEFFAAHARYSGSFEEMGFEIRTYGGGKTTAPDVLQGSQYTFYLEQPNGTKSWYCTAMADLDYDAWPDVLVTGNEMK